MAYVALEKLINIHDGYRKQFVVSRQELLLIQEDNEHYIIQANCPHMHWPLQAAMIKNGSVLCSKHGMSFSLSDGQADNDKARDCKALRVYSVAYNGNNIGIDIT